ncbi:MAG: hypothetical protein PHV42_02270 [Candidatus Pacebacteria bacterium]|nr:hypothetical protein [Candidatus Paceibacterota bacterium]
MFLSSLFKKPEHEISILFDISSRSVGGALLKLSRDGKPKILYTARLAIPFLKSPDSKELVSETLSALTKVVGVLEKEGIAHLTFTEFKQHKIRELFLVFSSPWYISQTKIARMEKEKPFTFTEGMLKEMLEHEKTVHEKAAALDKNTIDLFEQKVIQVKLNGYETSKPFGQTAYFAEANIFSSFIDSLLLKQVKDIALRSFHPKRFEIHSFPGVAYSVLRDIFPGSNDFLIVDVGGETTEISLVKTGGLLETFSFPIGYNQTLREISRTLEVSQDIALSSLSLFLDGKTFIKTAGKIEDVIRGKQKEWNNSFQNALLNFSEQGVIPSLIYLIAGMPFTNLFDGALKMPRSDGKILDPKNIKPLEQQTLSLHYERSGAGEGDLFLSLETVFLNKIFSKE